MLPEPLQAALQAPLQAPTRRLMVNADDFGLSLSVSRCIVELAQLGRVQSTSCLSSEPHWLASAMLLRDAPRSLQSGLHFNLTEGVPLSAELRRLWPRFPSLSELLIRAHLRLLPLPAIAFEWQAQWQQFAQACGHTPKFVDGHQHVHHLPGVRQVVLAELAQTPCPVRNTGRVPGPGHGLKRWVIERSGGKALLRQLSLRGLAHNPALLGVYDFVSTDYRALMRSWLGSVPASGALLFCHPGAGPALFGDSIAAARLREAAYLSSADFVNDLTLANVSLAEVWTQVGAQRSSAD